ncbi:MAG: signal recognition particle-docking protein FtsY [Planctomycetota bacterium]|nr:MAG: signal recognition particle-docking protein FtsY [Planctomycetota bacterium]
MGLFDRILGKTKPAAEPARPEPANPEIPEAESASPKSAVPESRIPPSESSSEAPPAPSPQPPVPAKRSFLARLKSGLSKTTALLKTDIRDLFKREGRLVDDAFLDELFAALVKTDMGVKASKEIVAEVRENFRARVVQMTDVLAKIKEKLNALMAQEGFSGDEPIHLAESGPTVLMICGVNGSGKTTSIAKLAHRFRSEGKQVVLGAADTFRAAAVEQLKVWASRVGAEIVTGPQGSDPASVAHRAVAAAIERSADICIVDTAGRLQTQTSLMQELSKIHRVINKQIPAAPHEVLLVLDATAGQNGVSQAKGFTEAVQCTGIVLAKLDGTAKGGVVVPIRQEFKLPVKFVGLGEKLEDFATFDPKEFTEALFADAE